MFWLLVLSLAGAMLLTVRHLVGYSGGVGRRWIGWGCAGAILCTLLMVGPAAEPLYTDGDWDRFVTSDFPAALPVIMAGLSFAACGYGLLRDVRTASAFDPTSPQRTV